MSADELFKHFELKKEQIDLFNELRKEVKEETLDNTRLITVICAKKTKEKCLKLIKDYRSVLLKYGLEKGMLKMDQKLYDTDKYFKKLMDISLFVPMPVRNKENCGILAGDGGNWVPAKKEDREPYLKVFFAFFEYFLSLHPKNTTEGVIFILDLSTFGWKNFDFHLEALFAQIFSKMPARVKKMVMINAPWYFSLLWNVIKPFYSKKMRERFVLCKVEELPEMISLDKKHLYKNYGGERGTFFDEYGGDMKKALGITVNVEKVNTGKDDVTKEEIIEAMKEHNVNLTKEELDKIEKEGGKIEK